MNQPRWILMLGLLALTTASPAGAQSRHGARPVMARDAEIALARSAAREAGNPVELTYHIFFGIKFLLGLGVMFIMSLVAGKTAAADRARQDLSRWLNIAWTSVVAIVILGAMMRMMHS